MNTTMNGPIYPLYCDRCNGPIPLKKLTGANRGRIRFCSPECAASNGTKRAIPLSTGTVGALSELLVCADLLRRGWHVFRAVSPSAPCDIVALGDGNVTRVEIRTGTIYRSGLINCPYESSDIGRSDMLAIVINDADIIYLPDPFAESDPWENLRLLTPTIARRMVPRSP